MTPQPFVVSHWHGSLWSNFRDRLETHLHLNMLCWKFMETSVCCDCRLVDTKDKADWIYVSVHSMILFTARSEAVIQACNWCYSVLAKAFLLFFYRKWWPKNRMCGILEGHHSSNFPRSGVGVDWREVGKPELRKRSGELGLRTGDELGEWHELQHTYSKHRSFLVIGTYQVNVEASRSKVSGQQ